MISQIPVDLILAAALCSTLAAADKSEFVGSASAIAAPPAEFAPMTSTERLTRYVGSLSDWEGVVRSAASAGIRQASSGPKEWGGGAEGYGLRIGNSFAQHTIQQTLRYGISAALHEDNRYFISGQTGFFHRTMYAVKSTVLARHDNGSQYFSFSRLGGDAGAAFISRAWQPRSTTSAGDGATSFGISIASDVGFNVFREFWPDLKRRFRKE
jgi:hypothetical protein